MRRIPPVLTLSILSTLLLLACSALAVEMLYFADNGNNKVRCANLDGTGVQVLISAGFGAIYGLTIGPATSDCSDVSMQSVWMTVSRQLK